MFVEIGYSLGSEIHKICTIVLWLVLWSYSPLSCRPICKKTSAFSCFDNAFSFPIKGGLLCFGICLHLNPFQINIASSTGTLVFDTRGDFFSVQFKKSAFIAIVYVFKLILYIRGRIIDQEHYYWLITSLLHRDILLAFSMHQLNGKMRNM